MRHVSVVLVSILGLAACGLKPQPQAPAKPISLADSHWQLVQLLGQAAPANPPTLAFDQDSRANGYAGCNRYFSGYQEQDQQLQFERIGSTRMACAEDRNALEQRFLRALETVRSVEMDGAKIRLLDSQGLPLMLLQPVN